jgi:16S rRNA (guanine527-N7)-methyltransferase
MDEKGFVQAVLALTEKWEIAFSPEQAGLCFQHITLMLEWNRRTNLTRITDLEEVLIKHLLDSLIPGRRLPKSGLILDIGTGPGFPGVPLKILHPDLELVLLESNRKKVSFLKVLLAKLQLKKATVIQSRLEDFDPLEDTLGSKPYDVAVMRAVHLNKEYLKIIARRILRPGGIFAWWAGPVAACEEESSLRQKLDTVGPIAFDDEFSYSLPSASKPRRLLLWRKES